MTPERAQNLLFTQGYLWTDFQFGIRKGSAPIKEWADLKGKAVAVNKGTPYETLSKKMGRSIRLHRGDVRHPARRGAGGGVRPCLCLAGRQHRHQIRRQQEPAIRRRPGAIDTKAHWAAPFRKDEDALRGQIDDVLKCMKKDGTVAKLSEKWFGAKPAPDDLENVTFPGHGVPGLPGYDPTAPDPDCSQYR